MTRAALTLLVVLAALAGCQRARPPAGGKPLVVTSFYPLWEFSRHVAGEHAEVVSLVPSGVEPHDWEPSPHDRARVERAVLFVYQGAGFDPWAERLLRDLAGRGPRALNATEGIPLRSVDLPGRRDPDAGPERSGQSPRPDHPAGGRDPHVWLDPVLVQTQVERIREALAVVDGVHAEAYAERARAYTSRLAELHQAYESGLARCRRRDIVVSHAAFAYLARRYGLVQVPVMGLAPESEPSPADLARIVRLARRQNVSVIFFETFVSPRLAETLAREIGARTMVLNPLEGLTKEEVAAGKDYLGVMRENLTALRAALECS